MVVSVICSGDYGAELNIFNWNTHEHIQKIDLGLDGLLPLEIRFLHDPSAADGFTVCSLSSTVFRIYKQSVSTAVDAFL